MCFCRELELVTKFTEKDWHLPEERIGGNVKLLIAVERIKQFFVGFLSLHGRLGLTNLATPPGQ